MASVRYILTSLVVTILIFSPLNISSELNAPNAIDPPPLSFAAASLISTDGSEHITLVPRLVAAEQVGDDSYYLTYEVGIPATLLGGEVTRDSFWDYWVIGPTVAHADSDSHNGCDSTTSVCATVFLYYTLTGNHGYYQKTTTRYTRSGPTVIWSNARQGAYCFADWYNQSGRCDQQRFKAIGIPSSGSTYTFIPSFAGSSNQMFLGGGDAIAGDQRITLKRGSSTWQFTFCVAYGVGGFSECW